MKNILSKLPRDWPRILCPGCGVSIENPEQRLKLLIRPLGINCPGCGKVLILRGNHLFYAFCGSLLLLLGGRLFSQDYPFLLSGIFFVAGAGTIAWGIFTAKVEIKQKDSNLH